MPLLVKTYFKNAQCVSNSCKDLFQPKKKLGGYRHFKYYYGPTKQEILIKLSIIHLFFNTILFSDRHHSEYDIRKKNNGTPNKKRKKDHYWNEECIEWSFLPAIAVSHSISKLPPPPHPRGGGSKSVIVDRNSTIIMCKTKALSLAKSNLLMYNHFIKFINTTWPSYKVNVQKLQLKINPS